VGVLYWENNGLSATELDISIANLPKALNEYKIVHISDLHGKSFGPQQRNLVRVIQEARPNLIAITGDLIDERRYDDSASFVLIKQLTKLAPVYFVTGNHEWQSERLSDLEENLATLGVKVLRNDKREVVFQGQKFFLAGIDDPLGYANQDDSLRKAFRSINKKDFVILLAHRPESVALYSSYQPDLILAGHAHGGQVRIPGVGGLIAPGQGFFPKYTSGAHQVANSIMVVSRGLGNSIIPQRLFNHPEVVIIKLKRKGKD